MLHWMAHRTWIALALVISLVALAYANDKGTGDSSIPLSELPAACLKAKANFHPITPADVEQARMVLVEAIERLDRRLAQAGPNGEDWRKYLQWDALKSELQGDSKPDKGHLTKIYARYAADEDGLELVWFLDVQQALFSYIAMNDAVDNPRVKAAFENRLDYLSKVIEAYIAQPSPDNALLIAESVSWLENARQAEPLVQAIRSHFDRPNLLLEISSDVLSVGIAEPVDEVSPVYDCILGTEIHATAHTTGLTSAATVPNPTCALLDTLFLGVAQSQSVGYHGPVTVFSSSTTDLSGCKRLILDADGLSACPASSCAETAICIQDIQSRKGRRLIERLAWRKAGKQQAKTECIASRHAEARLNERMDDKAAESIEKANDAYVNKFQRPFAERKLFPELLRFSTTEHALCVLGLQAGDGQLAAPSDPPPVAEGAEMSLRVHESMINNLAASALTYDSKLGRTIHEEKFQSGVKDLLGELPEKMQGDDDGQPWAITFAQRQPISVVFADDGFQITLRGARYYKGDESYPAMNVSAAYKIEKTKDGFRAVRQGEIEVLPPDFVKDSGQQIDAKRHIIRKLLEKRFAKVFEPEILGKGLELPGRWKDAGKMLPIEVVCRDGWLSIAWKRAPAEQKLAAEK